MKWWTKPALLGAALAVLTGGVIYMLPETQGQGLLAVLLATIAGVYIGIGIMVDDPFLVIVETGAAAFFLMLALLGLWTSPFLIALAYFLHGLWDLVHHPRYIRSPGPQWYGPLCVSYDWLVAAAIVVRY